MIWKVNLEKNSPDPNSISQPVSKIYVDNKNNDRSICENTAHVDFKDGNLENVRFIKSNSYPAIGEHAIAKNYVDQSIDEPTMVKNIKYVDSNDQLLSNDYKLLWIQNRTKVIMLQPIPMLINYLKTIETDEICHWY